jgi:hypothetical protein
MGLLVCDRARRPNDAGDGELAKLPFPIHPHCASGIDPDFMTDGEIYCVK